MRTLSTTACTGRSFDEFLDIYDILKEPLKLSAVELAVGIPFTIEYISKIKSHNIDTVIWHDAFWFVDGCKQETYPAVIAKYFELHKLFCDADINVPLWSIHPYKSHKPDAIWTDESLLEFQQEYWGELDYVLASDNLEVWELCANRYLDIVLENMLPNAPCYNNLQAIFSSTAKFCIDYSHINVWTRNNREQTIAQCLLATSKATEIHLSSNKGRRDSHDYIEPDEWFVEYLDLIALARPHLYITYESLPIEYKQYGRLDKK